MSVKFDVAAPFNFSNYEYLVVFNTTGNGSTPGVNPEQNNYAAYSYAIEVAGNGTLASAQAREYLRSSLCPTCRPAYLPLLTTPQQLQFIPNSNGSGSEFTVIFARNIFNGYTTSSPNPSASSTPAPVTNNWLYNAFVAQPSATAQLTYVDSMGAGGAIQPDYVSPTLPVNQQFDNVYYALSSGLQIDPPAQITSVELANNP